MVRKNTKIYVGNLPESCQNNDLQEIFEKYGKVEECDIVKNYGFVHMGNEDEAKAAIEGLNNYELMGSTITVEASHSRVRQRPGMGGKGQCYRCGRQGHWSKECPRNPSVRQQSSLPLSSMSGYLDRPLSRFGPERGFLGFERSYPDSLRSYERMRPYPDPYDRRLPSPNLREDFYYRRGYDDGFGYTRRSPPPPPPPPPQARLGGSYDGYNFSEDRNYTTGRLTPPTARRAPVF